MKRSVNIKLIKFYLWVGLGYFFLGLLYTLGSSPGKIFYLVFNNAWAVAYIIPVNFLLFRAAIPFVSQKRKNKISNLVTGILLLPVFLILYSFASYGWRLIGIRLYVYTPLINFSSLNEVIKNQLIYSAGSVFFFGIAGHIHNYIKLKQAGQQLRIENQQTELSYLKSQTNPHFLFNTLNNIYSLASIKSDLAPEAILRLSKILRFMLYETSGASINVEQELKVITDYIELEKLRYDETLKINFHSDVDDLAQTLPPLLLMPLVENAFKHGVSETRLQPFIDIDLSIKEQQLSFTVKNSSGKAELTPARESIGLSNLRRQLELLFNEYNLCVHQGIADFTVRLKINLAQHA